MGQLEGEEVVVQCGIGVTNLEDEVEKSQGCSFRQIWINRLEMKFTGFKEKKKAILLV